MAFLKHIILISFFSIIIVKQLTAQSSYIKFDQIGPEQDLSQSTVNAIVQDSRGFMWFGTDDGLNRYDGYTISVFRHDPADSLSLADNTITCLMSDSGGNLWIGTMYGGINIYRPGENKFYQYKNIQNEPETLSGNHVTSLFQDSYGDIWEGTYNSGLNKFVSSRGSFINFKYNQNDTTSLSDNQVWAISEDKSHNLWIATANGLSKIINESYSNESDRNRIKFKRYNMFLDNTQNFSNNDCRALYVDRNGSLWVGTSNSVLYCLDEKSNSFKSYNLNSDINKSVNNIITSVYGDIDNNLWIGTDKGLFIFDTDRKIFLKKNEQVTRTLYRDKTGILWSGTSGKGIRYFDWRRNQFRYYDLAGIDDDDGNGNKSVYSIIEDSYGELWIGTQNNGLIRFSNKRNIIARYKFAINDKYGLSDNKVTFLCNSKKGDLEVEHVGSYSGRSRALSS